MTERRPDLMLSVGFLLVPDFTMLALAAFVDTLRLAADEGDRSRPIVCNWTVMSEDGRPVRASNGLHVAPSGPLTDPRNFDYLVVVGGTLHKGPYVSEATYAYLTYAARFIPLVGICTGSFILARAGLMTERRSCVSWFHKAEFEAEFPTLDAVADQLFVLDRDRITCAGGTSVIHLASHLVERHCGKSRSSKGLRVMLEDRMRAAGSPQPLPTIPGLEDVSDERVRRAMLLIERGLDKAGRISDIAKDVGATPRHLSRLFMAATGLPPTHFRDRLRLYRAHQLVVGSTQRMTQIAVACGFSDASHFTRHYVRVHGHPPSEARRIARASPSS